MEVTEIVRSALLAIAHEHNVSVCGFDVAAAAATSICA